MSDRSARPAWVFLLVLIYGSFLISYGVYYASISFVDLPSFYSAARTVFGEGGSPYDLARMQAAPGFSGQTIFPFLYPPPSLLALYPLSLVSYPTAALLVLVANHALIPVFLYLFLRGILNLDPGRPPAVLAVALTLLFHPLVVTLSRGQVNLFVLVCICLAWLSLKRRHAAWLVALPLSVAALIKVYPAIALIYLIARRRFRIAIWFLAFLAGFAILAYLALPPVVWSDWFANVVPTGGYGKVPHGLFSPAGPWNQSINGFTSRLFLENEFNRALLPSPFLARTVPYLGALVLVGIAATLFARRGGRAESGETIDLELSLLWVTMFLVAPISWEHHLVLVLPAAIVVLRALLADGDRRPFHAVTAASILLLAWRLPVWADALDDGLLTLAISAKFYAAVCLWCFLVVTLRGPGRQSVR